MTLAIIGAAGSCGRQLAAQILERRVLRPDDRLQLVGHQGGPSADELWGLRADLEDAFGDEAPSIDVVSDPAAIDASRVVMLAGATISTDPHAPIDRAALGHSNRQMFTAYADVLAARSGGPPTVIVQSNPVELGVAIFAARLGRRRVLGAGAWSDTLRLRAELAADLQIDRTQVSAMMLGQHGDNAVPAWSQVRARDCDPSLVEGLIKRTRAARTLADLPFESRTHKADMLALVRSGRVHDAYALVQSLSPDLRALVKPFFTHFTAGHTTELATAHAVADVVSAMLADAARVLPAQVVLEGDWLDIHGVVGAPIVLGADGWDAIDPVTLADDEIAAIKDAAAAIAAANAQVT